MKNLILLVLTSFYFFNCHSQKTFKVRVVPQNISDKYSSFIDMPVHQKIFYAQKLLPKNFDTSGKTDYTFLIQKAINENTFIVLPNFPILINEQGLSIASNRILYFQKFSRINYSGPANTRESDILKIYNSKNVKIYNPVIRGSRFSKKEQNGEWSAGIAIYASENIEVYNLKISETYGDGIIIGDQSKNISVDGGWIDQARRDGISIISGFNVSIKNLTISNTNGTLPMCGIQIEPNFPTDYFQNISIKNITGYNNKNTTLNFNIAPLSQNELKIKNRYVTFTAENIEDYFSDYTISFVLNPENKNFTPNGSIKVNNVKSHSSNNFLWQDNGKSNVKVEATQLIDKQGKKVKIK